MTDTPENNSLPQADSPGPQQAGHPAAHGPQAENTPPQPSGGRILLHYFLAVLLLALLQAPRLADTLEEFAGEVPRAEDAARILRAISEHSGLTVLGEETSGLFTRLSPAIYLGAVDATDEAHAEASRHASTTDKEPEPGEKERNSAFKADAPQHGNGTTASLPQTNATSVPDGTGLPKTRQVAGASAAALPPATNATTSTHTPAANATAVSSSSHSAASNVNATLAIKGAGGPKPGQTTTSARNATASPPSTATAQQIPATNATASASSANATAAGDAPFESDKPVVLLIGDSMMMEGLGPALLRSLRTRDDIAVIREARYSTGLSRKDYFDWPAHMESLVKKYSPAVVIITMGGNDAQDIVDDNKKRHFVATESWGEQYKERASLLIRAAQKEGATVIWVGLPIMGNPTHAKRSLQLCAQQEAACTGNSPCVYVDTLELLTDGKGQFTAFVKGSDGKQVRIRYKDKIHVTTAGGEILTEAVLPELDKLLDSILAKDKAGAAQDNAQVSGK